MVSLGGRARIDAVMRQCVPDPLQVAKTAVKDLAKELVGPIIEKALYKRTFWPPAVESDEGIDAIMKYPALQSAVISEMLRFNHPAVSSSVPDRIVEAITLETFGALLNFAWMGVKPGEPLPKATGAEAPQIGNG